MDKSNIYSGRQGYESRYNTYKRIKKLTQNHCFESVSLFIYRTN